MNGELIEKAVKDGIAIYRVPNGRNQKTMLAEGFDGMDVWFRIVTINEREAMMEIGVPGNPRQGKNADYWYAVRLSVNDFMAIGQAAAEKIGRLGAIPPKLPPLRVGRKKLKV